MWLMICICTRICWGRCHQLMQRVAPCMLHGRLEEHASHQVSHQNVYMADGLVDACSSHLAGQHGCYRGPTLPIICRPGLAEFCRMYMYQLVGTFCHRMQVHIHPTELGRAWCQGM